tara:strand:- start:41 stop:472 length:432 start_codon:yes stop_codon:yes gene_type:complete
LNLTPAHGNISIIYELDRLKEQGKLTKKDEESMPTGRLPDCIAIATRQTCTFPNRATLIITLDSEVDKMYGVIQRLGKRAHGRRVGTVHFKGQLFSVKYNSTKYALEVPAVMSSGPGAFVISESQNKKMNAQNIHLSYASKER